MWLRLPRLDDRDGRKPAGQGATGGRKRAARVKSEGVRHHIRVSDRAAATPEYHAGADDKRTPLTRLIVPDET